MIKQFCLSISPSDLRIIKDHCRLYGKKVSPFLVSCGLNKIEDIEKSGEQPLHKRERRIKRLFWKIE